MYLRAGYRGQEAVAKAADLCGDSRAGRVLEKFKEEFRGGGGFSQQVSKRIDDTLGNHKKHLMS
jgi:hypothetical protein